MSYVKAPGNLGYFGGARHGLAKHRRTHGTPDWLVVCNVDLTFDTRALIQRLAGIQDANIGVIAPQIISTASGRQLNPYMTRRPTRLRMHVYKWLFQSYIGLSMYSVASEWLLKRRSSVRSDHKIPRRIYAAHGAFMIFSKRYFTCGATLEHPPFLFGEEISVAEQARNAGLSVIYDPQIRVEHEEHVSISTLPSRRVQAFHAEAAAFIAEKYF
ncbi:MAG TPA: hypothetical protein VFS47_13225 [Steroidobacteraceae bacterium]|nr:hypothetical protein [Steroidobacteraceae bacterium]